MASDDVAVDVYVHQKWNELTESIEKSVQEKWWNIIKSRYSEPGRKYHTFLHLQGMFKHMESYVNEIQCKEALSYGIFFHDIAYDAHSMDNEDSSKLFKEFGVESGIIENGDLIFKVEELIMASNTHCTDEHKMEGTFGKDDLHYFLDFDISVLGSESAEYKKYTMEIGDEYSFMEKPNYNSLRLKVLQLFLQIPNIFATQAFREKYEKQARCNIKKEIEWLKTQET